MATAATTPPTSELVPKYDVDAVIERLAALPNPERRMAFFAELETLPVFSRNRIDLAEYGRRRLCPGPYSPAEYSALVGIYELRRQHSPAETAMHADHAAAREILAERKAEQNATNRAFLLAELRSHNPTDNAAVYETNRLKLAELRERDLIARERVEEAAHYEVALRPHQEPRKQGAGRNWLRMLRAGGAE